MNKKKILVFFTLILCAILNASVQETFERTSSNLLNTSLEERLSGNANYLVNIHTHDFYNLDAFQVHDTHSKVSNKGLTTYFIFSSGISSNSYNLNTNLLVTVLSETKTPLCRFYNFKLPPRFLLKQSLFFNHLIIYIDAFQLLHTFALECKNKSMEHLKFISVN